MWFLLPFIVLYLVLGVVLYYLFGLFSTFHLIVGLVGLLFGTVGFGLVMTVDACQESLLIKIVSCVYAIVFICLSYLALIRVMAMGMDKSAWPLSPGVLSLLLTAGTIVIGRVYDI